MNWFYIAIGLNALSLSASLIAIPVLFASIFAASQP